jgi:hypothetical protein
MEVEIAFDLAPFFAKKMREQESGPESSPQPREQSRPRRRSKATRRMTKLGEQIRPDLDVSVFDDREPGVHVALVRVRFDAGERAVQKRGVGLVLPVVLERMNVGLGRL